MKNIIGFLILCLAFPVFASDSNPKGNNFSFDVATPCAFNTRSDGGEITSNSLDEVFYTAACGIGESFNAKVTFLPGAANAWKFGVTTITDDSSGVNNKECFEVRTVAWGNGADMATNQASNTAVAIPQITNPGTKTRFVPDAATGFSTTQIIKNHAGNTDCTGSPSSCEYAEVTVNVKRIACAANDVASDVDVRYVHINENP